MILGDRFDIKAVSSRDDSGSRTPMLNVGKLDDSNWQAVERPAQLRTSDLLRQA